MPADPIVARTRSTTAALNETRLYADRPSRRTVQASTGVTVSMPFCAQLSSASRRRTSSADEAEIVVQDLVAALERSFQHDEALVDHGIRKARVLLPAVLLPEIARPIPRTAASQTNGEEHD